MITLSRPYALKYRPYFFTTKNLKYSLFKSKLKVGDYAPDFTLPSTSLSPFTLSKDLQSKKCVLYFYPKDFSRICTKQAQEFSKLVEEYNIPVVGISMDTIEKHLEFKSKYNLPMVLLSDVDGSVCKLYDVQLPILNMPQRATFLLNEDHRISMVHFDMLDESSHMEAVRLMLTK